MVTETLTNGIEAIEVLFPQKQNFNRLKNTNWFSNHTFWEGNDPPIF